MLIALCKGLFFSSVPITSDLENKICNELFGTHFTNTDELKFPAWGTNYGHGKVCDEIIYSC